MGVAVFVLFQQQHGFGSERHRQGATGLTAAVGDDITPQIAFAQIRQIDKRQAAKQEHEREKLLRALQRRGYGNFPGKAAEHFAHLAAVEGLAPVGAGAGVNRTEQAGHVLSLTTIHRTVVNGTQRAQIGGYGVPTATAGTKINLELLQPFGGNVAKTQRLAALKSDNRVQTAAINMGGSLIAGMLKFARNLSHE
ncbi:hypothetical protein IX321_002803 [Bacteroides pyogenes]|nr:hypothetical protein [Bacteroides pyogenes]MBR8748340.1 hypothetical protein [Bacteroides pyogenes]MBR8758619.1 hypothetical protein [Bacteroides pyogenes]MBR8781848.1 hypothetical protein [Bacteroides pyogenes]